MLIKSWNFVLDELEKMTNFVPEFRARKKMSVYSLGIPFKITCSGDAASQFYNPLQDRVSSDKRASLDGNATTKLARNLLCDNSFLYNIY